MNKIYLKKGKEIPILKRHHWIFSGAIDRGFNFSNGEMAEVYSYNNKFLGHAYFNRNPRTLTGRMVNFTKENPLNAIAQNIYSAFQLRQTLFNEEVTNCYRVVNGEGDLIPGLVVDKYSDYLVIQVSTLGIEKIKEDIISMLVELFNPKAIYEKSKLPSRKEEGLDQFEGFLFGKKVKKIVAKENNIKFIVDFENSHKTGLYLDQREMRKLVGEFSENKNILNCFSYTGGFSLYAALNGAKNVTSMDISSEVMEQAKENFKENQLNPDIYEFKTLDVFKFLSEEKKLNYDFVILDPPAFAKKKSDIPNALSGYRKINREAMKKMPAKSFLLTCSCSYNISEEMFFKVISQASEEARRTIKLIYRHRWAMDHLINVSHSELNYLKSFLLYIE